MFVLFFSFFPISLFLELLWFSGLTYLICLLFYNLLLSSFSPLLSGEVSSLPLRSSNDFSLEMFLTSKNILFGSPLCFFLSSFLLLSSSFATCMYHYLNSPGYQWWIFYNHLLLIQLVFLCMCFLCILASAPSLGFSSGSVPCLLAVSKGY